MLAKMARSAPRSPFGVPRMTAVVRAAKRPCQNAAKAQKSTTVRGSSGNPGLGYLLPRKWSLAERAVISRTPSRLP